MTATVVNIHARADYDVYVGRGRDPRRDRGRVLPWGNPFSVGEHGKAAMRLYFDWLRNDPRGQAIAELARKELPGKALGCWCAPRPCHGEVLARLANGEPLETIRADVLERVGPENRELFA